MRQSRSRNAKEEIKQTRDEKQQVGNEIVRHMEKVRTVRVFAAGRHKRADPSHSIGACAPPMSKC